MTYFGVPATPPRLYRVWEAMMSRLRAEMGPDVAGQVYRAGTDPWNGAQDAQWWRLAIVPNTTAWAVPEQVGRGKVTRFNLRAEVHLPSDNWDPLPMLEDVQGDAFLALHGWKPAAADLESNQGTVTSTVRLPIRRNVAPEPIPLWDEDRDLWFTASEWAVIVETPELL